MGVYYEYFSHVGAAETGLYYQCRPSGVLSILQEAATDAACQFGGSGPEMLERYHAIWMLTRMWYRLDRPLMWNDELMVRTWHRGDKGAMLYRDFDLFVEGRPVGEAVSVWVLADVESRKLLRLSAVEEIASTGGGELCKSKRLTRVRMPEGMTLADRRRFHYSDTDSNGHVNNVRYADAAADAVRLEECLKGRFVSSLQIGYLKECMAGENVDIYTGTRERERFVHGVDQSGESRFDAVLTLDNLPVEE